MTEMPKEKPTDRQLDLIKKLRSKNPDLPPFTGATKTEASTYIQKYIPPHKEKNGSKEREAQWLLMPDKTHTYKCSNCGNIATKGAFQNYCDMCGCRMRLRG